MAVHCEDIYEAIQNDCVDCVKQFYAFYPDKDDKFLIDLASDCVSINVLIYLHQKGVPTRPLTVKVVNEEFVFKVV